MAASLRQRLGPDAAHAVHGPATAPAAGQAVGGLVIIIIVIIPTDIAIVILLLYHHHHHNNKNIINKMLHSVLLALLLYRFAFSLFP